MNHSARQHIRRIAGKTESIRIFLMLFCFLLPLTAITSEQHQLPAWYVTTTDLNIRSADYVGAEILTTAPQGTHLVVRGFTDRGWAVVDYVDGDIAYCSAKYIEYVSTIQETSVVEEDKPVSFTDNFTSFAQSVWSVVRVILLIILILLVIAFREELFQMLVFVGTFMAIGALIGYLLFDNAGIGANIGFIIAVIIGLKMLFETIGSSYVVIFYIAYLVVSYPFNLLNRLQYFLSEPWRFMFKTSWVNEDFKPFLRMTLEFFKIVLYIAITPLRLLNAVFYNILIHCTTELYDLFFEVLKPCDDKEGANDVWMWILYLPVRIVKYPIFHGIGIILESVIWTVIDVFIPAVTLYHGTDLKAGDLITRSRHRNQYLQTNSPWTSGTFTASHSSWGGIGVYFSAHRYVARSYACDEYRLSDNNPIIIFCRVSPGRIINYSLAPRYVYYSAGDGGNPSVLNKYGEDHGYTTGEWWNARGGYWEYCLFDWKSRYNKSWRIRPVCIFNLRTCRIQHVSGGMRHWLFDKEFFKDFLE